MTALPCPPHPATGSLPPSRRRPRSPERSWPLRRRRLQPDAVDPAHPDFGPNVTIFSPDTPLADIQSYPRRPRRPAARRRDEHRRATRSTSCRASTARPTRRCSSRSATTPRSPASARTRRRRRSTAPSRSTTAASRTAAPSNCLALVNFWRTSRTSRSQVEQGRPGRMPPGRQLLGRLAGRLDAPRRHLRRQRVAHGLLHRRPAVRERRLHRATRACPDTVNGSQQQWLTRNSEVGELEQRRLEPGVLRCRRRAERCHLPRPAVHDDRRRLR